LNADSDNIGSISRIDLSAFGGLRTRVEYRSETTGPGDEGPVDASRSADGDVLTFDFGSILDPQESSVYFFAMIDTESWNMPGEGVDEGGATATICLISGESVTLNVVGAVLPAPGALGLLGVAGLISVRRRR